jgi:hypothetical protein
MLDIKSLINEVDTNGVAVVRDLYPKKEIGLWSKVCSDLKGYILQQIVTRPPESYIHTTHYDKEISTIKKSYSLDDIRVLEVDKGRLDISFKSMIDEVHKIIEAITTHFIKEKYIKSSGLLISSTNADEGVWHRDVVNVDGDPEDDGSYDDSNMVHNMKPFYFTVLIPLIPLNETNGSTEFILGSHKQTYEESRNNKHIQFNTNIGDVIIFDGRIFHRGRANKGDERYVLYNIIHRSWYIETGE